jgi:hypothetical protein
MHGEVGAATVEAYRRAGAAAYNDQAEAERVRSELVLAGRSIWVIAGRPLTPIQQFAYDVSAELMMEGGGEFIRQLVLGPFHASSQVDYGDRGSGE